MTFIHSFGRRARRKGSTTLSMGVAHVADMMQCTIADVRDKVHRKELQAMRWGQQFRFFREEVLAAMQRVDDGEQTSRSWTNRE